LWPIANVPETYLTTPRPETVSLKKRSDLLRLAWNRALQQAEEARSFWRLLSAGFLDGLLLASTILGSILSVGTAALLLARETPVFTWLGAPLVPFLQILGLPDTNIIAPATLVGITEMFIPALLVQEAAVPARFFIAVLSISQLIFFSAVGPMMLDMFRAIPIRVRDLIALFLMRTALLLPILAAVTALLDRWGVF
jgi:nucleoside recognition membrane protein YjiH